MKTKTTNILKLVPYLMLLTSPAKANILDDCKQNKDINLRIESCTALIINGQLSPKDMAIAYYNRGSAYTSKHQYDHANHDFTQARKYNTRSLN